MLSRHVVRRQVSRRRRPPPLQSSLATRSLALGQPVLVGPLSANHNVILRQAQWWGPLWKLPQSVWSLALQRPSGATSRSQTQPRSQHSALTWNWSRGFRCEPPLFLPAVLSLLRTVPSNVPGNNNGSVNSQGRCPRGRHNRLLQRYHHFPCSNALLIPRFERFQVFQRARRHSQRLLPALPDPEPSSRIIIH